MGKAKFETQNKRHVTSARLDTLTMAKHDAARRQSSMVPAEASAAKQNSYAALTRHCKKRPVASRSTRPHVEV